MWRGSSCRVLGSKARQAATVIYLGAGLLVLLSIAGFAHALRTPTTVFFAEPAPAAGGTLAGQR